MRRHGENAIRRKVVVTCLLAISKVSARLKGSGKRVSLGELAEMIRQETVLSAPGTQIKAPRSVGRAKIGVEQPNDGSWIVEPDYYGGL
jgi:hypothetical protein